MTEQQDMAVLGKRRARSGKGAEKRKLMNELWHAHQKQTHYIIMTVPSFRGMTPNPEHVAKREESRKEISDLEAALSLILI